MRPFNDYPGVGTISPYRRETPTEVSAPRAWLGRRYTE
jgi:hypothetical protein